MAQHSVCVIGVGNELRGDDAAGLAVVRRLRERFAPGVRVIESDGDGPHLIDAWQACDVVVLIDAVQSGAVAGTVHRFDASSAPVPSQPFHYSSHALNVADGIELARALRKLPARVVVYGIEAARFGAGEGLSPEAERAVDEAVECVLNEIGALAEIEV